MDDDIVACVEGHMPAIFVNDDISRKKILIADIAHGLEFARRPCCVYSEMAKYQMDEARTVRAGHQRVASVDIWEDSDELVCIFHNPVSQGTQI